MGLRKVLWNLDIMKGQGTGKICSLYIKQGFVISRFFSIYFTIDWGKEIVRCTDDFVISRFHCTTSFNDLSDVCGVSFCSQVFINHYKLNQLFETRYCWSFESYWKLRSRETGSELCRTATWDCFRRLLLTEFPFPGRVLNKGLHGQAPPRGKTPYSLLYTIFDKRYRFSIPSIDEWFPFTYLV